MNKSFILNRRPQVHTTRHLHSYDDSSLKYWETRLEDDSSQLSKNITNDNTKDQNNEPTSYGGVKNGTGDKNLTHVDSYGKAKMVDVGHKQESNRMACATATIILGKDAFSLLKENKIKKGDVLSVANIAGIMAAKNTSSSIPLCHNIPLSKVSVDFILNESAYSVVITSEVKTYGKTGVEMEAIVAVSVAACTIYDMCKAVNKEMVITDIKLLHKSGGVSGCYDIST